MKRILLVLLIISSSTFLQAAKPNVLFIAIDDLNDWIGALGGHPQARTPNLDKLAKRGVLFTRAYCAAPSCNPSRAALMTGILPSTSGVYYNSQPWRAAMPRAVTLPQHFTAHGYWSAGSGKIYHGRYPDPASWQTYFPDQQKNRPVDPLPASRPVNGIPKTAHFDWGPVSKPGSAMGDYQVADWIIKQLKREHDKPFFLACGIYRPHLPWYVPKKYFDLFDESKIQLPATMKDDLKDVPAAGVKMAKPQGDHTKVSKHKQWKKAVHGYLASIAFADEQVGRVLTALEKSPHADNTIIALWTDHGWHLGEKEHWRKFTLWERAGRTPVMFVVPEGISKALAQGTRSGMRVDQPVGLIDIYPTLIDLCGLQENQALEGRSLVPLLADPGAKWTRPALTTYGRNNHAVRTPQWRYIRYADGSEELYDHSKDPNEWTNLAGQPQHVALKKELAGWFPKKNAPGAAGSKRKQKSKKK
ncbi:MAG: sulfatase [Verrucomicrobiaceae bacterium]|nr:sulfatase [Verrucomicrobiaceae bacterium]